MKKLLALVLALVMTLGLATVGTNAALSDTFKDAKDINYEEAVAVMNAIGVIIGDDQGNFRAGDKLTRGEAAKIIAYLRLGNKTAEALGASGTKFTDVPTSHWACKYIEYCAAEGIINGVGDNKFDPNGQLLTIDFAKMLLGALNYDAKIEGMTGADYRIFTSSLADRVGIFDGNSNAAGTAPVTRDEAALYSFNTIKSPLVQYNNKGGSISINGADISLGASDASYVVSTIASQQNISDRKLTNTGTTSDGGYTVEFGERYYPKLKLSKTLDDFGRPSNSWTYDNKEIGNYVDYDKQFGTDYTTKVTGKTLYELIGGDAIKSANSVFTYFVDGKPVDADELEAYNETRLTKNQTGGYGATGKGVLTQIFKIDYQNEVGTNIITEYRFISVHTYIAKVSAEYNKTKNATMFEFVTDDDDTQIEEFYIEGGKSGYGLNDMSIKADANADDMPSVKNLKLDQYQLVNVAWQEGSKYEIVAVCDPSKTEEDAKVTKWSSKDDDAYLVTGGQQQDWSKRIYEEFDGYDQTALDVNYNLIYDLYGYVIFAEKYEESKNYVFLSAFDLSGSNRVVTLADAFLIFLDGTTADAKINVTDTDDNINKAINIVNDADDYTGGTADYTYIPLLQFAQDNDGSEHYNKWFTYTKSGEGKDAVYTLKPVYDKTEGVYRTFSYEQTDLTQKVSTKNPNFLNPVLNTRVYGNNDSVYMTVGKKDNSSSYGTGHASIAKVTGGPYTGVQSVTLKVSATPVAWEYDLAVERFAASKGDANANVSTPYYENNAAWDNENHNVFVVYDKDKYVIGAIVFGDGEGSKYYTYAVKGAQNERKEGSYYYWEFQGIVDGELKTLTVKDTDNFKVIDRVRDQVDATGFGGKGIGYRTMFSLTYDKDGYVTDAEIVYNDGGKDSWYTEAKWDDSTAYDGEAVYDVAASFVDDVDAVANGLSTYTIADRKLTPATWNVKSGYVTLTEKGATLYQDDGSSTDVGLTIASGAPIWVVQNYRVGGVKTESFSTFKAAIASLEDITDESGVQFRGIISAALNSNGTAKWVVIKSNTTVENGQTSGKETSTTIGSIEIGTNGVIYINEKDTYFGSVVDYGFTFELYRRTESQSDFPTTPISNGTWNAGSAVYKNADAIVDGSYLTVDMLLQKDGAPTATKIAEGDSFYVVINGTTSKSTTILDEAGVVTH